MRLRYLLARGVIGLICAAIKTPAEALMWWQSPRYHRFCTLEGKMLKSYRKREYAKVETLALEYLKLANRYRSDWNYGNAIHDGHMMLGLVRLAEEDIKGAKKHLLASGRTPGSPQLNSFGPSLYLAKGLLEKGEKNTVLKYLASISRFWIQSDMPEALRMQHTALMEQWKADIEEDRIPELWRAMTSDEALRLNSML